MKFNKGDRVKIVVCGYPDSSNSHEKQLGTITNTYEGKYPTIRVKLDKHIGSGYCEAFELEKIK